MMAKKTAEPETQKLKAKMVMIYSHHKEDRDIMQKAQLEAFLKNLVEDLWWDVKMSKPDWDKEIRRRLNSADIIICMVSEAFLASEYVKKVESVIASRRASVSTVLVVPILLKPSMWDTYEWLKKLQHFPTDRPSLHGHPNRSQVYRDLVIYIRKWFGEVGPIRDSKLLRSLRMRAERLMTKEELKRLKEDSCKRAEEMVKDKKLRQKIVQAAKRLKKNNKGEPLETDDLAKLDEEFLAEGRREPDPKFVRWVLRCAGLHPQGSYQPKRGA